MVEIAQNNLQNNERYEEMLNIIETEISELKDDNLDNDDFNMDLLLTTWFAEFIWKEKAKQLIEVIESVYSDDKKEKPKSVKVLLDFLEAIAYVENDAINSWITWSVDLNKKYGFALDGSEYNENNSFTSRSGITYKLYDQTQGWWPRVSKKGCMVTSAAVVSSSLWNYWVTPWIVFRGKQRNHYPSDSVPVLSGSKLKSKKLSIWNSTSREIIFSLQNGDPAIIMAYGKKKWGSSKFTSSQHYMALLDISEDWSMIFVGNSYTGLWGSHSSNGRYPTSEVLTSVKEATTFSQA